MTVGREHLPRITDQSWAVPADALLFDCDGVLVDSDASVLSAWTRWSEHYGLDPAVVFPQVHGRRAADSVASMVPAAMLAEAVDRINRYELEDAASVRAVPGAHDLTATLSATAWAVVTSATRALATARLSAAGIRPPATVITADDLRAGKPAPEGYLLAAAGLGRDPQRCVVLEDAQSGVLAARAAGVEVVIGLGPRALETDAGIVVPDLTAVEFDERTGTLSGSGARLR
jgi:sugar-phosphatase